MASNAPRAACSRALYTHLVTTSSVLATEAVSISLEPRPIPLVRIRT
jgi:hypothetical protein